jgi:hypothetical protein
MAINASDFSPASVSGTVTVNSSAGTSSTVVAADQSTEGPEKFVIKLRTGSITGPVVAISNQITINDTSVNNPTYSFQANVASVSEGQSVKFTLVTTDIASGTAIPYEITGVSSADINGASLTGNFTVNNSGTATIDLTITTTADLTTEGNETLTIRLTTAPNNPSVSITIVDSSVAPPVPVASYQLTNGLYGATPATTTTQNEGAQVYFYLSITNGGDLWGTDVPYTITGVSGTDIGSSTDSVLTQGKFQIPQTPQANPVATVGFNITEDMVTEGIETMVLTLNGKNVSSSVIINDTSTTPLAPPTYSLAQTSTSTSGLNRTVAESATGVGAYITFTLLTTNVVPGTSVPFTVTGIQQADVTGLTWDNANSRFTGAFVMQNADPSYGLPLNTQTASIRVDIVADLTTEGDEVAFLSLNNGQASVGVNIIDNSVSPVVSGSFTISTTNTRAVPVALPAAAMWVAFRVIGAGGSGAGPDGAAGGSGGGAQYARGIVKLPATPGPKTMYGFAGRPARGGTSGGRAYDLGGQGENCSPGIDASGAQGEINGPSGASGEGGGGGGASSLYYQATGGDTIPIVTVGGGGGGGGGSWRTYGSANANIANKGFITFGAGLTGTTPIPGLKANWCRLDGGGGGGGGGAGGKEGFCGDDGGTNARVGEGGSAGYVIRNDSDGLTWNTFDWYGIGPVPPSTEGVAVEAPQPFPWVMFGRGGYGGGGGSTYGQGGQMGAIAVYYTTAVNPPDYSMVPDWAYPTVLIPASILPNRDMQASSSSNVTFYAWGEVEYNIDGNISKSCFIQTSWGNDPINGIGEFLEILAVSAAPSNGKDRGAWDKSNFQENVWTPLKPTGPFGYYIGTNYNWMDVTVSIRRRDNQAVLRTVTYYNITGTDPWFFYNA